MAIFLFGFVYGYCFTFMVLYCHDMTVQKLRNERLRKLEEEQDSKKYSLMWDAYVLMRRAGYHT